MTTVGGNPARVLADEPEVVVSLGTDHHLFDRLVDWMDTWLADQVDPPSCLIQYGASRCPTNAEGVSRLPRSELLRLYGSAKVVIVQGGPGSILDAREVGVLPIAVPRRPEKLEVVDGHQIAFTKTMELHGEALSVDSEQELRQALESALHDPSSVRKAARVKHTAETASNFGSRIETLIAEPLHSRMLRKMWLLWRAKADGG